MSLNIPRYKINTLWGFWGFVQDNKEGKFCEYRDYVRLQREMDKQRLVLVSHHDYAIRLETENQKLKEELKKYKV
jgi:hypothetical protein